MNKLGQIITVGCVTASLLMAPLNANANSLDTSDTGIGVGGSSHSISDYRLVGEISFRKFIFHIYDAELRVEGSEFSWERPYALTLTYARKISRDELVEASLAEIARIGDKTASQVEYLREPLTECFVDVRDGDKITGHSLDKNTAVFYFNEQQTCNLKGDDAVKEFFSIWLGEETIDPKKSLKLRGLSS